MKKLFALLAIPLVAGAHPMGNFSINHYAAIKLSPGSVEIRYIVDMAEIPTLQEMQKTGMPATVGDSRVNAYLAQEQKILGSGLDVRLNGSALRLQKISGEVIFPPGAGGLPTMKMGFVYRASFENVRGRLSYRDTNFPDRAGWKEIVASAQKGVRIVASSVPAKDRSLQLTNYPTDTLGSPPQDVEARIQFVGVTPLQRPIVASTTIAPVKPAATLTPNVIGTPKNAFTELVNKREWGFWFLVTAAFIAAGLGAFHALEPGHGKTIVAAYLVGSQGTALHACMLGLIVTASHTAGVYLLGAVTLYASRYIVPERLYPWLGAFSGLTIAALGIYLLWQRWRGKHSHHDHVHPHSHSHPHVHTHDHAHPHVHHHHHHPHVHGSVSKRQLLALGITGGIVPCPAALVVLLSAVALHRIAFGLFLILAFSIGLAAVLIGIGLLMVYARRFMAGVSGEGRIITRWLPITSSVFITVLGFAIAFRALGTV